MRKARYCFLLLLLAGSGHTLNAAPAALPEFFGVYVNQGERILQLEPCSQRNTTIILGAHELSNIEPVHVVGEFQFLVHIGGATEFMEIPIHRLERVAKEVDARTGSLKPLRNLWYAHQSDVVVRVAPVSERPGLLVRATPTKQIPPGFWALELRGTFFPFAVGGHPERAAGCLQRNSWGGYEPCRPTSAPSKLQGQQQWAKLSDAAGSVWGFGRGLGRDLWETTVVRSTTGLILLLVAYAALYWLWLLVTRTYFLEIAPFRVWGDAAPKYLAEGLAACVVDELQRLQKDIRDHGKFRGSRKSDLEFHKTDLLPPVSAQVTIEFKGMSPEALHAFLRRSLGRYALITCDLLPNGSRLRLRGRSGRAAPWEVEAPNTFGNDALRHALREFAVHVVVAVRPSSRRALANALAHKQGKAFEEGDDEEALRLARLGLVAMPDQAVQLYNCGVAYQKLDQLDEAIKAYTAAIGHDEKMTSAFRNRAVAYGEQGELDLAEKDLLMAQKLDPKDDRIARALDLVQKNRQEIGTADQTFDEDVPGSHEEPRPRPQPEDAVA